MHNNASNIRHVMDTSERVPVLYIGIPGTTTHIDTSNVQSDKLFGRQVRK